MSNADCCQLCCCCITCFSICGHSSGQCHSSWCSLSALRNLFGCSCCASLSQENREDEAYAAQVQREMQLFEQRGSGFQSNEPAHITPMQTHTRNKSSYGGDDDRHSRLGSETATLVSTNSHTHNKSLSSTSLNEKSSSPPSHTRALSSNSYGSHLNVLPPAATVIQNQLSGHPNAEDDEASGIVLDSRGNAVAVRDPRMFR